MQTATLTQARITGTEINYLFVCTRKLWLFHHHIEMEHTSDYVALGQFFTRTAIPVRRRTCS